MARTTVLDQRDGLPGLLVVIPLGALAIVGLLVGALCWISGAPGGAFSGLDAGSRTGLSVTDELETEDGASLLRPSGGR